MIVHPTGAGKTLTALATAEEWELPTIVVTRAALRYNWLSEIRRFTTNPERYQVYGYEEFRNLGGVTAPVVIFDECHKTKDRGRRRVSVASVAAKVSRKATHKVLLTATPIPDRIRDLWSQLNILDPVAWPDYWAFAQRYCDAHEGTWGWVDEGSSNLDELSSKLAPYLHVVSAADVFAHMPPKTREVVYVPKEALIKAPKESPDFEGKLRAASAMKRKWVASRVKDALAEGERVVVLTGRRTDAHALAEKLGGEAITGEHPAEVRQALVDAYQAGHSSLLVATGGAIGEGFNLHTTTRAMFAMLPWNPGQLTQWEGRFWRLGQKKPVAIEYLIAEGTVDEDLVANILDKQDQQLIHTGGLDGIGEAMLGSIESQRAELIRLTLGA